MTDGLPPLGELSSSPPAPGKPEVDLVEPAPPSRRSLDWPPLALSATAVVLLGLMLAGAVSALTLLAALAVGWTLVLCRY